MDSPKLFVFSSKNRELNELRQVVARHQRIFNGSHGYGYFDWDLERKHMHWSGGYWRYLGYSEDDIAYISNTSNYFDYVHPDDIERVKEGTANLLKNPGPGEVLYRTRRKKGGYVWTEIRADTVRDESGWVTYMSGVAFDVTKQKQIEQALMVSEARHARILQSSNDGMWEWAAEYGGFYFSNRCWEHLGFENPDEVSSQGADGLQPWRARMHPEDGLQFDKALAAHVNNGEPFDVEYRIQGKDGEYRWIRGRGQMTFNEQREPLRMSGTNMDVTELKRAEGRVIKAKEQAESANRAKSEFLSSMSHELRTPLNAILGFAQLIELSEQGESPKDHASEIRKAGQHLLELVGDVLDLAQIESGKLKLSSEAINPVELLEECFKLLNTQAVQRDVTLVLLELPEKPCWVSADRRRLRQVFLNLLSNAIKYNRVGGEVRVVCQLHEPQFRVCIEDTGRGIPKERQKEMFQPFNRLGAERGNIEGSGVGLVVTKELVNSMGGSINFTSQPSVGSQFWVDLPLLREIVTESGSSEESARECSSGGLELCFDTPLNVLYIEDNVSNQRLLAGFLKRFKNVHLQLADDALKGIYLARIDAPDFILMDINLPKLSGYEALEVLKKDERTKGIPVVALSANAMTRDLDKARDKAFYQYLTKPLDLQKLVDVFNGLFAKNETSD